MKRLVKALAAAVVLASTMPAAASAATVLTSINVTAPTNGSLGSCPTVISIGSTCTLAGNAGFPGYQIGVQAGSPNIFTITQSGDFFVSSFFSSISISGNNTPITSASFIDATGAGTFGAGNIFLNNGTLTVTVPGTSTAGAVIRIGIGTGAITSAVPETATWMMMILGFGAMGAALRRRRGRTSIPAIA
jgi:hypothetical protein